MYFFDNLSTIPHDIQKSKAYDNLLPPYLPLTLIKNRSNQKTIHWLPWFPFHPQAKHTKYFLLK